MARTIPRSRRTVDRLSEIPDDQLACRSGRHDWPLDALQAGRPLPRGLAATRQHDGSYQLQDTCRRCRKTRVLTTLPRGVYDVNAAYSYRDPENWVRLDAALDVTKRDLRAENIRRNAHRLFNGTTP